MEAQQKITEVQGVMGALKQHLGAELAPIITDLGERLLTSMAEGEGGVKGLAETIAVKLMQGLGFSIEALRFFHNGWLGIKLVGQTALNVLAHGVENLYKGLRVLLTPLDEIAEFAVWAGALDVNPFDKIEESLGTFSSVTSDVTDQVLDDIERTNAGYDKVGATIDSYVAKLQEAGGGDASATVEAHRVGQTSMTATEQAEADKRRQIAEKLAAEKEALGQSLLEKTNQLTMEELEYKQWALEQEIAQMQQMAGDDQMLQQQILEYRKAALAEFAQESATTNAKMTSDMTTTAKKVSSVFTNNLEGALLDSMGRTENSWSSMLKAMLAKLVAVLAEMAAAWAASQVAQEFGWAGAIHHTGLWSSPGEHIALVEDRELIIPSKQSDGIRQNLGGFSGTGTWDAIEAATAMYNVDDWTGGYAIDLAREYVYDIVNDLIAGIALGSPGAALTNITSKETLFSNAANVYGDKQQDAYNWDDNYAGIGSALLRAFSFFTLGGFNPYADAVAGVVGGKLGNRIGDLIDDRKYESLLDAREDGYLDLSDFNAFKTETDRIGIGHGSVLGGLFDKVSGAWNYVTGTLSGIVSSKKEAEAEALARAAAEAKAASEQELGSDYTHNISTWSSQYGGPASVINYGTAQSIGYSGGSSGSASYNSSTGGYDTYGGGSAGYGPGLALGGVVRNLMVPHGDHGYAALSYDEGVVDADTMKILSRSIRSGEFGGTSQIVAAVLGLRSDFREFALEIGAYSRKVSEIIDHWQANGLPATRVAA